MTQPDTTVTVTSSPYPAAWRHLARGRFGDLLTCDLRLALLSGLYTPDAGHEWWAAAAAAEVTGPGYPAGGAAVTGRDIATIGGREVLTCFPVDLPAVTLTCRHAVVYAATGDPATAPLLSRVDLGAEQTYNDAPFSLTFAAGLLRIGPGLP